MILCKAAFLAWTSSNTFESSDSTKEVTGDAEAEETIDDAGGDPASRLKV
jgi:hypothetical protein